MGIVLTTATVKSDIKYRASTQMDDRFTKEENSYALAVVKPTFGYRQPLESQQSLNKYSAVLTLNEGNLAFELVLSCRGLSDDTPGSVSSFIHVLQARFGEAD